jgi:hypothetical protein
VDCSPDRHCVLEGCHDPFSIGSWQAAALPSNRGPAGLPDRASVRRPRRPVSRSNLWVPTKRSRTDLVAAQQCRRSITARLHHIAWCQNSVVGLLEQRHEHTGASGRVPSISAPLTALIGRATQLQAISEMLRRSRLLTVIGPAGVGKTRIAIELGIRQAGQRADGVWLVDLASVRPSEDVAAEAARVLGIRRAPRGAAIAMVRRYLADRDVLLCWTTASTSSTRARSTAQHSTAQHSVSGTGVRRGDRYHESIFDITRHKRSVHMSFKLPLPPPGFGGTQSPPEPSLPTPPTSLLPYGRAIVTLAKDKKSRSTASGGCPLSVLGWPGRIRIRVNGPRAPVHGFRVVGQGLFHGDPRPRSQQ